MRPSHRRSECVALLQAESYRDLRHRPPSHLGKRGSRGSPLRAEKARTAALHKSPFHEAVRAERVADAQNVQSRDGVEARRPRTSSRYLRSKAPDVSRSQANLWLRRDRSRHRQKEAPIHAGRFVPPRCHLLPIPPRRRALRRCRGRSRPPSSFRSNARDCC